jgi:hypothetical protein
MNTNTDPSIADAERIIFKILPNLDDRTVVLEQLLSSTLLADKLAPTAWGATLLPDGFRLNVGSLEALVVRAADQLLQPTEIP